MTALKKRNQYTTEYKKEAVALVTEKGYAIKQAVDVVDTSEKNLRRWIKDLKQDVDAFAWPQMNVWNLYVLSAK